MSENTSAFAGELVTLQPGPVDTRVQVGVTTYLGIVSTIAGAAGTTIAALKSNDTATAVAGISTILTAVATLGGRFAQAVALAKEGARLAKPYVDELAKEQAV